MRTVEDRFFEFSLGMLNRTVAFLRNQATWFRRLPQATGLLFAARTSAGRSLKIALFGIGVVLPLGSLIWALLFWHGSVLRSSRRLSLAVDQSRNVRKAVGSSQHSPPVANHAAPYSRNGIL